MFLHRRAIPFRKRLQLYAGHLRVLGIKYSAEKWDRGLRLVLHMYTAYPMGMYETLSPSGYVGEKNPSYRK